DFMLHRDNTEKNVIYWQDRAEKLEREGKLDLSVNINEIIDRALNVNGIEPTQSIKTCVKLAQALKLKGDTNSAKKFAMNAMKIGDLFCERRADKGHEILDDLEQAASLLLSLDKKLDDKESTTV